MRWNQLRNLDWCSFREENPARQTKATPDFQGAQMTKDATNLPAVREQAQIAVSDGLPGQWLLDFLDFFAEEVDNSIETLRNETVKGIEGGDPSARIRILNSLKTKVIKIEKHMQAQAGETRSIATGLVTEHDRHVLESVEKRIAEVFGESRKKLRALLKEFEL